MDCIIYNSDVEAEFAKRFEKNECGHKHFEALGNKTIFEEADNFKTFIENI